MSSQMQYQSGKIFPNLAATKLNTPITAVKKYGNKVEKKKEEKKIIIPKKEKNSENEIKERIFNLNIYSQTRIYFKKILE